MRHRFGYRLYMAYLDLAEVPSLVDAGLLSQARFGSVSFLRRDHFGDPAQTLEQSVRALVRQATGSTPQGPIRVLTQLRVYGYYFSPLNLFYCHEPDGALHRVVAEVQNTPWLERHCYVLWPGNRDGAEALAFRHPKNFHVSPFMGMEMQYRWRLSMPAERLRVFIANEDASGTVFRAGMQLRRLPLDAANLKAVRRRHPWMTARISAAIYAQAFQLWRKRCPFYPHPRRVACPPQPMPWSIDPASLNASTATD